MGFVVGCDVVRVRLRCQSQVTLGVAHTNRERARFSGAMNGDAREHVTANLQRRGAVRRSFFDVGERARETFDPFKWGTHE